MTTPLSVLIVEDDGEAARMVSFYLEKENLSVISASNGPEGERLFRQQSPQLVIMDVNLPGFDGLELCRRIRQASAVPILMLTGRSADTDKAIGLGIGADDYLTKPFSPVELVARVKALARRAYQYTEPIKPALLGGPRLTMDTTRRQVSLDKQPLNLTPTEFNLLQVLMANPGWVFTREHLLERVWGFQDDAGEETVTAHMSNLRRKLGPGGHLIQTVRGGGYLYEESEETDR
ncbi:MAG TPA: response regulator transcription factor [Chloroflexia bacterium]|nr:response regulator transcription factor [Chloroflexia bacterium]